MPFTWNCEVPVNAQLSRFFSAFCSRNISLSCVTSVSKTRPSWAFWWRGEGQAGVGQTASTRSSCHYLGTTANFTSRPQWVNAGTTLDPIMPDLLACTRGRGVERLIWCTNFGALYLCNKAGKQESDRIFQPLQRMMLVSAQADSTGSGESGKKKSAPFGEVVAKLCSIKDKRCWGCAQAGEEAPQKGAPRRANSPAMHAQPEHYV